MHPIFEISTVQGAFTGPGGRAIECTVIDEGSGQSGELVFTVDDRDGFIEVPPVDTILTCSMGYEEKGLYPMGSFKVTDVFLSGWPQGMTVKATATPMGPSSKLKEPRQQDYHNQNAEMVLDNLAMHGGLDGAVVDPKYMSFYFNYLYQDESDLQFANRLGEQLDATVKVADNKLVMVKNGEGTTATGKAMPSAIARYPDNVLRYEADIQLSRPDHTGGAAASSWVPDNGEPVQQLEETPPIPSRKPAAPAGDAKPIAKVKGLQPNGQEEAKITAKAKADEQARKTGKLTIHIIGDPRIMANATLQVINVREYVDGPWSIIRVQHTIDRGGFVTSIEAEFPLKGGEGATTGTGYVPMSPNETPAPLEGPPASAPSGTGQKT